MRSIRTLTRIDLSVWRRTPWVVAAALVPPLGMAVLVAMLTVAVSRQPVALVVQDHSPQAEAMADIIRSDTDTYALQQTSLAGARTLLARQQVCAIIVIPKGFGRDLASANAKLDLTLNNIDYDFSDDIRRSISRSVSEYDAPQLGVALARSGTSATVPNPYRVDIDEHDLRQTNVDFLHYQVVPVLLLLIINVGMLSSAVMASRDRERGTDRVLTLAPVSPMARIAGRLVAGMAVTFGVLIPTTAILVWTHQIAPPGGHWLAVFGILALTTLFSVSLGIFLGSSIKRSSTVALSGVIVASYLFFLGGGFTTIAFLPNWLRDVSQIVPTRYAIDSLRQALFYPTLLGVVHNLIVVGGFALLTLGASVLMVRKVAR
ncbi:MAG TPA: ABC transporter permease [Acidimicrobiales bacterium]|nr:ABC transporter permease [Acidimicrobiales bacterium]